MNLWMFHPINLALHALLDGDTQAFDEEVLDLCIFFRAMTRRWPVAMAAFRMFQVTAQKRGKRLPPAATKLFAEFENEDWRQNELKRIISMYPVEGDEENTELDIHNMSDFFEMLERLDVGS